MSLLNFWKKMNTNTQIETPDDKNDIYSNKSLMDILKDNELIDNDTEFKIGDSVNDIIPNNDTDVIDLSEDDNEVFMNNNTERIDYDNKDMYDVIRYQDPFHPDMVIDFYNDLSDDNKLYINQLLSSEHLINGFATPGLSNIFNSMNGDVIIDYIHENRDTVLSTKTIKILDCGSGTGRLLDVILAMGTLTTLNVEYTGIDFNENLIGIANYKYSTLPDDVKNRITIKFKPIAFENFTSDDKYDLIFFNEVFNYDIEYITNHQFFDEYFKNLRMIDDMDTFVTKTLVTYYTSLLNDNGYIVTNFLNNQLRDLINDDKLYLLDIVGLTITLQNENIKDYELHVNYKNMKIDILKIKKYI